VWGSCIKKIRASVHSGWICKHIELFSRTSPRKSSFARTHRLPSPLDALSSCIAAGHSHIYRLVARTSRSGRLSDLRYSGLGLEVFGPRIRGIRASDSRYSGLGLAVFGPRTRGIRASDSRYSGLGFAVFGPRIRGIRAGPRFRSSLVFRLATDSESYTLVILNGHCTEQEQLGSSRQRRKCPAQTAERERERDGTRLERATWSLRACTP
jgi:hypothetical protein